MLGTANPLGNWVLFIAHIGMPAGGEWPASDPRLARLANRWSGDLPAIDHQPRASSSVSARTTCSSSSWSLTSRPP